MSELSIGGIFAIESILFTAFKKTGLISCFVVDIQDDNNNKYITLFISNQYFVFLLWMV